MCFYLSGTCNIIPIVQEGSNGTDFILYFEVPEVEIVEAYCLSSHLYESSSRL